MKETDVTIQDPSISTISDTVQDALVTTFGLLYLNPNLLNLFDNDTMMSVYLRQRNYDGFESLEQHMIRVYHGFLLQSRLDNLDTSSVDLVKLRKCLPEPQHRNFFREFFNQSTEQDSVNQRPDLMIEYAVYYAALLRLVSARTISLVDIDNDSYSSHPFATIGTNWLFKLHPEWVWSQITSTYQFASQLKHGGVTMTTSHALKLLRTAHLLATEANILGVHKS